MWRCTATVGDAQYPLILSPSQSLYFAHFMRLLLDMIHVHYTLGRKRKVNPYAQPVMSLPSSAIQTEQRVTDIFLVTTPWIQNSLIKGKGFP